MHYVIIPGIGGSKIYCNCNGEKIKMYPKQLYRIWGNLDKHFFEECKSVTRPLMRIYKMSCYHNLVKRLGKDNTTILSYDWRKNPVEIAKSFLDKLIPGSTLIGHSNGGFILRILFEYFKVDRSLYKNVFICATPNYGSLCVGSYHEEEYVYRRLNGDSVPRNRLKSIMFTKRDVDKIFKSFPNELVYYIPSFRFMNDKPRTVDVIDFENAKILHITLSRYRIDRYHMYYNTGFDTRVSSDMNNDFNLILTSDDLQYTDNRFIATRKLKTDSLVVPSYHMIPSSVTLHDNSNLPHCLIMNSEWLINKILES